MRKNLLLPLILILLTGCTAGDSYSTFTIDNSSSLNIAIEYYQLSNGDTAQLVIVPNNSEQIWEVTAKGRNTNWYYDFGVNINHIINSNGDTLLMNPNIASNWVMYNAGTDSYYHLPISDSSF